jgi:phosphocarrier protein
MMQRQVTLINKLGLHARAAAQFVNTALRFESDIQVSGKGRRANGKSIMALMMLSAPNGTPLDLEISGNDEQEATEALVGLIENRFGEEE